MQLSIFIQCCCKSLFANPYYIRNHIIVVSKNYPWSEISSTSSCLTAPIMQGGKDLTTHELVFPMRLLGHIKVPVNNLIAPSVKWVRKRFQIMRCPAERFHKSLYLSIFSIYQDGSLAN